jgi:hypothetical protein
MAAVAGRCPALGVHPSGVVVRDPAVQPSGVQPSGVQPSGVRSPGFVVRVSGGPVICCPPVRCPALCCPPVQRPAGCCPPVQRPAGCCPPRRSGPVRLLPYRAVALGPDRCGGHPSPRERVQVPVGCRAVERFGRRPRGPGRGRCCRTRVLVSGASGGRPGPGWVRRRRVPGCATSRPGRHAERPWLAAERGHRMRLRRAVAAPAAWLPSGAGWRPRWVVAVGSAARVGGPGGRPMGVLVGMACGPSAAQASSQRSRLAAGSALTCADGWWACQDLNLGPHPYQGSTPERRAIQPFRWSCYSVSPTGMG